MARMVNGCTEHARYGLPTQWGGTYLQKVQCKKNTYSTFYTGYLMGLPRRAGGLTGANRLHTAPNWVR